MQVVAIANDITYNSGAFGPKEDAAFRAATEYALEHQSPVMYLAANSGARVGLANEVKQCLKVEWVNPAEPQKGFKYLYLSDEDYQSITGQHLLSCICRLPAFQCLALCYNQPKLKATAPTSCKVGAGVSIHTCNSIQFCQLGFSRCHPFHKKMLDLVGKSDSRLRLCCHVHDRDVMLQAAQMRWWPSARRCKWVVRGGGA